MYILEMVLDSSRVHNFHYMTVAQVKMSLFLGLIWTRLYILIIKIYILILGLDPTQELHDTNLTAEAQYLINFSISNRKFCLSLHYNGSGSFSFVNGTKIYQFKAKDSEMKKISFVFRKFLRRVFSQ